MRLLKLSAQHWASSGGGRTLTLVSPRRFNHPNRSLMSLLLQWATESAIDPRTDFVALRDSLLISVAIMMVPVEEPAESFHPLPKVSSPPACSNDPMVAAREQKQRQQGRLVALMKRGRTLRPSMSSGMFWRRRGPTTPSSAVGLERWEWRCLDWFSLSKRRSTPFQKTAFFYQVLSTLSLHGRLQVSFHSRNVIKSTNQWLPVRGLLLLFVFFIFCH